MNKIFDITIIAVAQTIVTGARLGVAYLYFTKFNTIPVIVKFGILAAAEYVVNNEIKKQLRKNRKEI